MILNKIYEQRPPFIFQNQLSGYQLSYDFYEIFEARRIQFDDISNQSFTNRWYYVTSFYYSFRLFLSKSCNHKEQLLQYLPYRQNLIIFRVKWFILGQTWALPPQGLVELRRMNSRKYTCITGIFHAFFPKNNIKWRF